MNIQQVWCMRSFEARLVGMHGIAKPYRQHCVLFFNDCRWVHTLGLYSPHAVLFLDSSGDILKGPLAMKANRVYGCSRARDVVELPIEALVLRQSVLEQELENWRRCAQRR